MTDKINPHGVKLTFGKHHGTLITRVPVSYLKFMINSKTPQYEFARAEFDRRGDTMPEVEITGHAIDAASIRVRKIWHQTAIDENEGLYTWLQRITLEAIDNGTINANTGKLEYLGLKLVVEPGEEFPVLKTIMK